MHQYLNKLNKKHLGVSDLYNINHFENKQKQILSEMLGEKGPDK